jgi:hypothetical protein
MNISKLDDGDIPIAAANYQQQARERGQKWRTQKGKKMKMAMQVQLHLPSLGVSVMDKRPQELVYISAQQVKLSFTSRESSSSLGAEASTANGFDDQRQAQEQANLTAQDQERRDGGEREVNQLYYAEVGHLQMDNMDRHSHFPVTFTSSLPSYSAPGGNASGRNDVGSQQRGIEEKPPFLSVKFERSVHPINEHIKNFTVLMQAVDLNVDEELVKRVLLFLLRMQRLAGADTDAADSREEILAMAGSTVPDYVASDSSLASVLRPYIELLMVHPIRLNMTFARIPYSPDQVYVGLNPLLLLIDAMQVSRQPNQPFAIIITS